MPEQDDIDTAIDELDLSGWSALEDPTKEDLQDIYEGSAARGLHQVGVAAGQDTLDQVNADAVAFAGDRAGELITEIGDSTRELIRAQVTVAVERGWSTGRLAAELQDSYAFSAEI